MEEEADWVASLSRKATSLTRVVDCCATCNYYQGWLDNMFCSKHEVGVRPYLACDDYEREDRVERRRPVG